MHMTHTRLNNPSIQIIIQLALAVAYVVIMRQLLALEVALWGEGRSDLVYISRMLLAVTANIAFFFLLNYAIVRALFYRLGLLIGLAIFGYYYIYNPYGHNYVLVYFGIFRSPPHLLNMLLLVAAPAVVGKIIDTWLVPDASQRRSSF